MALRVTKGWGFEGHPIQLVVDVMVECSHMRLSGMVGCCAECVEYCIFSVLFVSNPA